MNKTAIKHGFSILALFIFALLSLGSVDTEQGTKSVQSQPTKYKLAANELFRAYERNEVAADSKYKGEVVEVSGIVRDIGKDIMGNIYIVIGGGGFLDGVQCTFPKSEANAVAKLSKGHRVTVKGKVQGKMGNVLIEKSRLL